MLAARVLSRHFKHVTLFERDHYPSQPLARAGVPQARHLHALLMRGHRILEELFPGITQDARAAGAELLDVAEDFAWRTPPGWGVRFSSGIEMLAASRPLIDAVVHRRLAALSNVDIVEGCVGIGLGAGQPGRLSGAWIRHFNTLTQEFIAADLVVDASGRMSRAPEWLKILGYEPPAESIVDANLGYASRLYRRRPEQERRWRAVFIQAAPPEQPRAGIAFPVEGDQWIVTMCGGGGDHAPTTEAGYLDFARSLPSGEVYNLIRSAEPLSPIVGYRRTENLWRHYERLKAFPDGFVIIGDAACAFNPVYGQGMTTAALAAMKLDDCLRTDHSAGFSLRFQKQLAQVIATPWALATGEDLRYATSSHTRPRLADRLLQAYVGQVMTVSTYDPSVRRALLEVFTMMSPPSRLMHPAVMSKVILGGVCGNPVTAADTPVDENSASGRATA
jgi:2-polyprenyl-6-methoxyphenol hydroxylase-like FAD-dependent oxidoreductase